MYNITEIEPLDGYELADPVEYRMESGKDNIVNITNKPLGRVIVHHYLLDSSGNETTTKLADDESYSGKDGEIYTTVPRVDIDGYMLKRVDGEYVLPTNREGIYQAGQTIEVNYYYQVANYELTVHHYIEGTNTPVPLIDGSNAEDEKFEGTPGEIYVTNKLDDDVLSAEYELAEEPRNKTGVYEDGDIEVTYYYKIIKRNITLMKYDEDGTTPLSNAKFSILNKDESKINKIIVGKLQNNGTYGFVQSNGKYVSNNTKHDSTVANSYIKIDLTQETKDVEVTVNAQVSSEDDYDYGYVTITESTQTPDYNNANGRFISISGSVSAKDYKTVITPGKVYYLHLGYRKDGSASSGSDCFTVNSILINGKDINLYGESQYIFETDSNGMISTELEAGTYEISEVQAPEGYDLQDDVRKMSITRETPETIEIIDTKTRGNVITHHYIEGTTDKVLLIDGTYVDDEEQIGVVGDMYATREKDDIVGYEYVSSTDNTSGQYIDGTIEVTYYYRLLNYKYTVNYLEKDINEQIHESKDVLDIPYMTIINSLDEIIDIDGYNYDSIDSENIQITENEKTNIINIYYTKRKDLGYTVNYLEKDTDRIIKDAKYIDGVTFKDVINAEDEVIEIYGYNYDSVDKDKLTISTGLNEITIYYTKKDTRVIAHFYEENSTEKVSEDKIVEGKVFDEYVIEEPDDVADKYELASRSDNYKGTMTEDEIEVVYYYRKKATKVVVRYYEEGTVNKLSQDIEIDGRVDDPYVTEAADDVPIKYELVEEPVNKNGIMTIDTIEVIYYYRVRDAVLNIRYLEKGTDIELAKPEQQHGKVEEDYITGPKTIECYTLVEHTGNEKGKFEINPLTITYYYLYNTKATVQYIDKITGEILEERTEEGLEGDEFKTESKNFENYILVEEPEEKNIYMTKEDKVLKYYYIHISGGVIEKHVDIVTGELLDNDVH